MTVSIWMILRPLCLQSFKRPTSTVKRVRLKLIVLQTQLYKRLTSHRSTGEIHQTLPNYNFVTMRCAKVHVHRNVDPYYVMIIQRIVLPAAPTVKMDTLVLSVRSVWIVDNNLTLANNKGGASSAPLSFVLCFKPVWLLLSRFWFLFWHVSPSIVHQWYHQWYM